MKAIKAVICNSCMRVQVYAYVRTPQTDEGD